MARDSALRREACHRVLLSHGPISAPPKTARQKPRSGACQRPCQVPCQVRRKPVA